MEKIYLTLFEKLEEELKKEHNKYLSDEKRSEIDGLRTLELMCIKHILKLADAEGLEQIREFCNVKSFETESLFNDNKSAEAKVTSILNFLGFLVLRLSSIMGYFYTKSWSSLNISWFDHLFDHLCGPSCWHWYERGILGYRVIRAEDTVLDLCCGDGIYSGLFFSQRAKFIDAIDKNSQVLSYGIQRYQKDNVQFHEMDVINEDFPQKNYDVVFLFAAIEHFSIENGTTLLQKITKTLLHSKNGTFFGSTPIFPAQGGHNVEHDNEFTSTEQLKKFLSFHFMKVGLWCSKWSDSRTDCYFECNKPIVLNREQQEQAINSYRKLIEINEE